MESQLPWSQACENNKQVILDVLVRAFKASSYVLELGSGTGQHCQHFCSYLRHLVWQPSDRDVNLAGLRARVEHASLSNLEMPVSLDVTSDVASWPQGFDAVYSANTAHIMSWEVAQLMLKKVGHLLPESGVFVLYGPFNYGGRHTSESNATFDHWLRQRDSAQGIRDQEAVCEVASKVGLTLLEDIAMPANNRSLVFVKSEF